MEKVRALQNLAYRLGVEEGTHMYDIHWIINAGGAML